MDKIEFQIEYETIMMMKKLLQKYKVRTSQDTHIKMTNFMYTLIHLNMLEGNNDDFSKPLIAKLEDIGGIMGVSFSAPQNAIKMAEKMELLEVGKQRVGETLVNTYTLYPSVIRDRIYRHLSERRDGE